MRPDHILIFAIFLLIILIALCQFVQSWRWFRSYEITEAPKEKAKRQPKPSSEDDCPDCCIQKACPPLIMQERLTPRLWSESKSPRGRKKEIHTHGYACNNPKCDYFHVMDASVHALVGNGCHGKYEDIQDLKCQVCKKKFSVRRDTVLYRLKTHSKRVAEALGCLAEGMDVSALERVMNIGEGTLRSWLARSGQHAEKLHSVFFQELIFAHIQLDELWANVRKESNAVWVWVATDATTKLIPVVRLGPRTLDMAMAVVHDLRHTMQPDCTPVYTTDGLNHYFSAITAHHGEWVVPEGSTKAIWQVSAKLLYGRVKKFLRRRRLVKVVRSMLCGELENLQARLQDIGLSGRIQTSFVERVNLTIRQGVSFLARRTWGTAQFTPELELHLQWWRSYYHFSRYHESLRVPLASPIPRKGKQLPRRYRSRTPAMAAGLTNHRWSVLELISYPLP